MSLPPKVPIGPIKRVLDEVIVKQERIYLSERQVRGWRSESADSVVAGVDYVAHEIARYSGMHVETVKRQVRTIRDGRGRKRYVTFEWADRILCALDREYLWYADPELAVVYAQLAEKESEDATDSPKVSASATPRNGRAPHRAALAARAGSD